MNIKDKIAKLLALAESPNENEARMALLKARELMATHKLSMRDIELEQAHEVLEVMTKITCTKYRDPWAVDLSSVIASNHCCQHFIRRPPGHRTATIGFLGFEDDVTICKRIFEYAYSCIQSHNKATIKELGGGHVDGDIRATCDSYSYGFVKGTKVAFDRQSKDHQEWGLVVVIPKEVRDAVHTMKVVEFQGKSKIDPSIWREGYADGCKFDPSTKLEEVK